MEQEYVYLIISNYEDRTKIHSVATKEAAANTYAIIDSGKPDSFIREKIGSFNTKYYSLDETGNKVFREQLYIERRPLVKGF